jgi:Kef-type K+ transport system membrane component KefB
MQYFLSAVHLSTTASIIMSTAAMLMSGFLMTRLTRLIRIPDVTAYILAGILIGPCCLNLVPAEFIEGSDFLADIALAFIAFSVGEFFKIDEMKKNGIRVVIITIFEACIASAAIFAVMYGLLHLQLAFSILLAALAAATAPASTIMTIRQTGAHGEFVNTLLQVVALDDVVGLVEYSIAISIALASLQGGGFRMSQIGMPILVNTGVLALGCLFGLVLKWMLPERRTTDNRLIIAVAILFAFCGICTMLDVSPLLGCMSMAMVYINVSGDSKLFRQLNYFSPPILLLFFVRSGMTFRLDTLTSTSSMIGNASLLSVGVLYFIFRIVGKYAGAWLGCLAVGSSARTRNCLGLALIPQAGVAIGLAALCARTLGGEAGNDLQTIILASSVLYELIGPGCGKLALYLSGSYSTKLEDLTEVAPAAAGAPARSEAEILIERIQQIQKTLPSHEINSDEEAYDEAAMQQEYSLPMRRGHFINSR